MSEQSIEWTPKARAVLVAASELFYERGIAAVGVEAIAQRAGVTKKTLYDRFGSKERLVVEYLLERDRGWRELLDERLALREDPLGRVLAVFETSASWAGRQSWRGCCMVNAHAEISEPSHPAYEVIVGQKRWMLALFLDLAQRVGADDPQRLAEELVLLHEGTLTTAAMGVFPDVFERAGASATRLVAESLSPAG